MTRWRALTIGLALLAAPIPAAWAEDHQVLMVNKDTQGRVMQFEPAFLKVAVGDTVTFVNKDKGHNAEALTVKIPNGAEGFKGKINQEITVTFGVEGFYPYKCLPHAALGMVGLIQVGEAGAPDAALAEGLPGKGKTRMQDLIAEAGGA